MNNKIKEALIELSIKASETQINLWLGYLKLLKKWNKVHNMTSIQNIDDMLLKHLFDSLAVANYLKGSSTIDVGTGGGLPGVVLAILYPNHHFTLVDSVGKKIIFIKNVKRTLNLLNINSVNCRVEDLKGNFDNIISRAFSSVDTFYNLCNHFLTDDNQLLAMKGSNLEEQILEKVPLYIQKCKIKVPFLKAERNLIIMRKKMFSRDYIKESYMKIKKDLSSQVNLLAVSKYQPLENIKYLSNLGQKDFGENYFQELKQKAQQLPNLRWHFIGSLQSRKIKHIVKYVNSIQSVETIYHLEKINRAASELKKMIDVYLQINIDNDPNKSGFKYSHFNNVIDCIKLSENLNSIKISGLMCIPNKSVLPQNSFKKMKIFFNKVNLYLPYNLKIKRLSMGMSVDYKLAIQYGSTDVRIGNSLFGIRKNK